MSDAALILAAYHEAGERLPEWLAGDFALALFDPRAPRLLLTRDPIGVRPLYYAQAGSTLLFASEIKSLLAHPAVRARPNDDLLADFLLDRVYDGSLTFFDGILSVPPAHQVWVRPDRVQVTRYWDFNLGAALRLRGPDECAEAFRHVFAQAVRRRLRDRSPVAVSVSGGLDSSSIFCEALQHAPGGVAGISYVSEAGTPSDEAGFLGDIEQLYGVSIHRFPAAPGSLLHDSGETVRCAEAPLLDEQWPTTRRLYATARALGARTLLTGHWGDQVLFSQAYLVDWLRTRRWREIGPHLREFAAWMTDTDPRWFRGIFLKDALKRHLPASWFLGLRWTRGALAARRPWYSAAFRRRALRRLWAKRPVRAPGATAHACSLYEEVRTGYHVLCMEWNNKIAARHGLDVAFPFLDRDLLQFLMAVPADAYAAGGVPRALLRGAMRGVLPDSIAARRWKADFTHLINGGIGAELPRVLDRFDGAPMMVRHGYVDARALARSTAMLRRGLASDRTATEAWTCSDLVALDAWLETFCGSGCRNGTPTNRRHDEGEAHPLAAQGVPGAAADPVR